MARLQYLFIIICLSGFAISADAQKRLSIEELQYSKGKTANYDSLFRTKGYIMKQSISDETLKVYHYYTPDGDGPLSTIAVSINEKGGNMVELQTKDKAYYTSLKTTALTAAKGWKAKPVEEKKTGGQKVKMYHYTRKGAEVVLYATDWYCVRCL